MPNLINQGPRPHLEHFTKPFFSFSLDSDGRLLYLSPSFFDVLGYQPTNVIGKSLCELLDTDSPLNRNLPQRPSDFFCDGVSNHMLALLSALGESRVIQLQLSNVVIDDGIELLERRGSGGGEFSSQSNTYYGLAQDITESFLIDNDLQQRFHALQASHDMLSAREREVLAMVVEGRPNKSIARKLDVTERAVEQIRARLMVKLESDSAAEMVSKATEYQLLLELLLLSQLSSDQQAMASRSQPDEPTCGG